ACAGSRSARSPRALRRPARVLTRGMSLAHHDLAGSQRQRIFPIRALPVNPDVEDVLPTRQLPQPRRMAAAQLQGQFILVGRDGRIENDVRPLAPVDPELLPDLASLALAGGARKVAPAPERIAGGQGRRSATGRVVAG